MRKAALMLLMFVVFVLAGCGSDDSTGSETTVDPEAALTEDAETWASLFGTGSSGSCDYFQPPGVCKIYLSGELTPFEKSYADASVIGVSIDGNHADVKFDNGDTVVFVQEPDGWKAQNLGGNLAG